MNNKKVKSLLIIFSLINTVLLSTYGYLLFVMKSKNNESTVLYMASHQAASDKERTQELARMLKETEADRKKISSYFFTKANAVTLIEQIENIGKSAGVDLAVNSVSDEAKDTGVTQLSFSATGSFAALYRLVALTESMPYKITLKRVDIQEMNNQTQSGIGWKGNFTIMLGSFVSTKDAVPAPTEAASSGSKK